MSDVAIRVENLSKSYRIGLKEEMHDTLFDAMADFVRQPIKNLRRLRRLSRFEENGRDSEDIIWALKDVSFEVERGEVVGIIGRAGAVVTHDVPDYALVLGVPACQKGWMSRHGHRLHESGDGGIMLCPESG